MPAVQKKRPTKSAAYVELEHELGIGHFHCPVCGKALIKPEEGIDEKPCTHVVLIHDWVGEFVARDQNIQILIDRAMTEAEEKDGYAIELLRKAFDQNVVFFEFLEPGWGPKDPQVTTIAIDMGMAGRRPEK
jgi:hypothetical protein